LSSETLAIFLALIFVSPSRNGAALKISIMIKFIFSFLSLSLLLSSCGSLNSTTSIKPNNSFVLGNNIHNEFKVRLKNESPVNLEIWRVPIEGGQHSPVTVKPNEILKFKVEKNTALLIKNRTNEEATVNLLVKGDLGLSMDFKN
jgi:hypothetical protein